VDNRASPNSDSLELYVGQRPAALKRKFRRKTCIDVVSSAQRLQKTACDFSSRRVYRDEAIRASAARRLGMTRLLATTALVGALLAAPALAQTMNSAPTPAPAPAPMAAAPDAPAGAPAQSAPAQAQQSAPAQAQSAPAQSSDAPQAGNQAPVAASGSSMRPAAKIHHRKPGDDSANRLNQAELQKLRGQ
jgi:hypothetical protein